MNSPVVTVTLNPAVDKTVVIGKLQVGGLNRVQDVRIDPGGKGINVAKVLIQFGVNVIATGLIGGSQGQQLLKQLERENIQGNFLQSEGETRVNLKIVEEETKLTTEINEPGILINPEVLNNFSEKLSLLLNHASVIVLGGSLPPGIPEAIYKDYIELANRKGVKTILDAEGVALEEGIKARPFAVKPNIYELEKLIGKRLTTNQEIISAGKSLVQKGVSLVMVSMGEQGSIVLTEKEAYRATPFTITPQSTVGAGDSMVATLVYSLLQGYSLEEIARWTTTAGTVTASKTGTQVCTLEEVQHFLPKVQVSKI